MLGPRLQSAGIDFLEVKAVHRNARPHVTELVLASPAALEEFKRWAVANGITCDEAGLRVATAEELATHEEILW